MLKVIRPKVLRKTLDAFSDLSDELWVSPTGDIGTMDSCWVCSIVLQRSCQVITPLAQTKILNNKELVKLLKGGEVIIRDDMVENQKGQSIKTRSWMRRFPLCVDNFQPHATTKLDAKRFYKMIPNMLVASGVVRVRYHFQEGVTFHGQMERLRLLYGYPMSPVKGHGQAMACETWVFPKYLKAISYLTGIMKRPLLHVQHQGGIRVTDVNPDRGGTALIYTLRQYSGYQNKALSNDFMRGFYRLDHAKPSTAPLVLPVTWTSTC